MITVREAVERYEEELTSLGRAPGTVKVRIQILTRFTRLCDQVSRHEECPVSLIDPDKMTRFFLTAETPSAKAQALATMRGFMKYAVRNNWLTQRAADKILGGRSYSPHRRKPKHYIRVEDFPTALDLAGERHPVERIVFAIALYTLCRESEVGALHLRDVNFEACDLAVWRKKRQRHTTSPISPEMEEELVTWLTWYAEHTGYKDWRDMVAEHGDWYLVPKRLWSIVRHEDGRKIGAKVISGVDPTQPIGRFEGVIKRVLDGLNVRTTETGRAVNHVGEGTHTVRRSGARALFLILSADPEIGSDRALIMVAAMLDHDDPRVTLIYIGVDIERDLIHNRIRTRGMYGTRPATRPDNVVQVQFPSVAGARRVGRC